MRQFPMRASIIVAIAAAIAVRATSSLAFSMPTLDSVPSRRRSSWVPPRETQRVRKGPSLSTRQFTAPGQADQTPPAAEGASPPEQDQMLVPHLQLKGQRSRNLFVASVAAFAAFSLHMADSISKAKLGLPLWAGPSAGVCVMFAVASVAAAEDGALEDYRSLAKFAAELALAVTGSCLFAVFTTVAFTSVATRRTLAVGFCAAWMLLNKHSAVFPPSAGYCALYIDHVLAGGPMATLGYVFSVFPCALGVMVVLAATRGAALLGTQTIMQWWPAMAVKVRQLVTVNSSLKLQVAQVVRQSRLASTFSWGPVLSHQLSSL